MILGVVERKAQSAKNATILSEQPKDSRILEIKMGLCKASQGRILERM